MGKKVGGWPPLEEIMKSVWTCGIVVMLALWGSHCSSTLKPQELNYTKQGRSGAGDNLSLSLSSCTSQKELKGSVELQKTFSALLGSESATFAETHHNQFTTLDGLAGASHDPETVRSYLKVLHQLALAAANSCSQPGAQSLASCRCENLAAAQGLLARAVPADHCGLAPGLAEELALACQQNYRTAVSSLFSSLALARRTH